MNVATPPPGAPEGASAIDRLALVADQIVQEFGYDDDVDESFRAAVEARTGGPLEDEDYTGEIDAALIWWRTDDGDLTDALVDVVGLLEDGGFVALLTPRTSGGVEASEIEEAAATAGLRPAGTFNVAAEWRGVKLAAPRSSARR